MSSETDLFIKETMTGINNITKSTNKDDFIKGYDKYLKIIKSIDEILCRDNTIDENTDIKTLFEMLNSYESILNNGDITVENYKNLSNIVELIDKKLSSTITEITEI